jgi:uncharacterized protein YndB with AHSA1/START domain
MAEILHNVGIKAQSGDVYNALATLKGLSGWWTSDTTGDPSPDGVIHFRFGTHGFIDMRVRELQPEQRVVWQVVDGPTEWAGTKVFFDLKQEDDFAIVSFRHEGWKETAEFRAHCSTKWAVFLMSLKSLVETGKGAAWPNDTRIGKGD